VSALRPYQRGLLTHYANPADPRLRVPKPSGIGWTVNMSHAPVSDDRLRVFCCLPGIPPTGRDGARPRYSRGSCAMMNGRT
jgi:hypothetical protein